MQGRTVGSPRTITGKQGQFGSGRADVIAAQPMLGRAHGSRPALFRSLLTVSLIAGGLSAALIGSGVDLGKVGLSPAVSTAEAATEIAMPRPRIHTVALERRDLEQTPLRASVQLRRRARSRHRHRLQHGRSGVLRLPALRERGRRPERHPRIRPDEDPAPPRADDRAGRPGRPDRSGPAHGGGRQGIELRHRGPGQDLLGHRPLPVHRAHMARRGARFRRQVRAGEGGRADHGGRQRPAGDHRSGRAHPGAGAAPRPLPVGADGRRDAEARRRAASPCASAAN